MKRAIQWDAANQRLDGPPDEERLGLASPIFIRHSYQSETRPSIVSGNCTCSLLLSPGVHGYRSRRAALPAGREWDRLAPSFYARHPYPCAIRPIDLRAQSEGSSALRTATPRRIRVEAFSAAVLSTDAPNAPT